MKSKSIPSHPAQTLLVRECAMRALDDITRGALLDQVFEGGPSAKLNPMDRALLRMIVTTTLRHLGQIDQLISHAMNGGTPNPEKLRTLLRISVAQLVFTNIPDHAVVNLSVDLATRVGLARQKNVVNAVLRRLTRDDIEGIKRNLVLNIPPWLYQEWEGGYGDKSAQGIAAASLSEAPLDITVKDPQAIKEWGETLGAEVLPAGTLRLHDHAGRIDALPGFDTGAWWVQDAASSLPVNILGNVTGLRVLDLCAAPGGKTAQLCARGAHVTALDNSPVRLQTLRENLERLQLRATIQMGDATTYKSSEKFDVVLLDAPCTATGTLRRHPDILLHRQLADIDRLARVQGAMLDHAMTLLKPNGRLIYATCSLQPQEGEEQIKSYVARQPNLRTLPIAPAQVGGLDDLVTPEGWVRVLPMHLADLGGMDGFFIAQLVFRG